MKFKNGDEYIKNPYLSDPMIRMFLLNKCLRPSCHACAFKTITRQSDVTLADFWGVGKILPKFDDGRGVSLVLVHSQKGQKLFDEIKGEMTFKEVDFWAAVKHNKMYYKSTFKNPIRRKFFKDLNSLPFEKIIRKYGRLI